MSRKGFGLKEAIREQSKMANKISKFTTLEEVPKSLLACYSELGKDIALVLADFKCENPECTSKKPLTFHHLVPRKSKKIMDRKKYFVQRNFYTNLTILCIECHSLYHYDRKEKECFCGGISSSRISHLKEGKWRIHYKMKKHKVDEITHWDEKNIWSARQNNPELVVKDCQEEFNLTDEQCDKLRFILLKRGVNKWLYARRKFIAMKHELKEMLKEEKDKERLKFLHKLNEKMQNIARMPRWVEWPDTTTRNWKKIEEGIVIRGRNC